MAKHHGLKDIYNLLFAGKKLSINFPTVGQATTFRVKMHQYKKLQETAMLGVGLLEEEDKSTFSFLYDANTQQATLQFTKRRSRKTYSVKILGDDGLPEDEVDISLFLSEAGETETTEEEDMCYG